MLRGTLMWVVDVGHLWAKYLTGLSYPVIKAHTYPLKHSLVMNFKTTSSTTPPPPVLVYN